MMNWLHDDRTQCFSVITNMSVRDYLALIQDAHASRGSLSGQRDTLKTTTAKRIRSRMVSDIRRGAVLPPVVIGATIPEEIFTSLPATEEVPILDILPKDSRDNLSIIDGMQRTAALIEASDDDATVLDRPVRIEFWLTKNVQSMIYRMLVLNTGQVPWTLNRQLSVVFAPLLEEVKKRVPEIDRVFTPDKSGRRFGPAQFSGDSLVELYIAFSLRKTSIDTREALSEEFSRIDFVENLSDDRFQEQFYETLGMLATLDRAFSRYEGIGSTRFSKGRNIFDGQPARSGFVVAVAQQILGRPGLERPSDERERRMTSARAGAVDFANHLEALTVDELGVFLKLDVLQESLNVRVGQVGRYERNFFFEGFKVLLEEQFQLPSMEPCWRAS